jgi:serine/threonine-protein kinase
MTLGLVGRYGLDQWLTRGQPSHATVLSVLCDAARGLAAAHAAGVAHGDLTARRIRVDERGKVLLVDFDRAVDLTPDPRAWGRDEQTVELEDPLAPETRSSGRRDPLSDQYCFCAIAWEALTGRRAPLDPNQSASGVREFRRDPSYRVLARGLSSSPTDRWPSMSELVAELARDSVRPRVIHRWWRSSKPL